MAEYEAIQGLTVQLNCNLTKFSPEDAIQLVFWYKGESNKPIYSVDARNPQRPRHFNYFALKMFKGAANHNQSSSTNSALIATQSADGRNADSNGSDGGEGSGHNNNAITTGALELDLNESGQLRRLAERLSLAHNYSLKIERLSKEDSGLYRCRVDFRYARTLNTIMRLHVIGQYDLHLN